MKYKLYITATEYSRDCVVEADNLEEAKYILLEKWNIGLIPSSNSYAEVVLSDNDVKDSDEVDFNQKEEENA